MDKLPVTLCVSTRNAAADLDGCIQSVKSWVSEIVVVDMQSTDQTVAIAEAHGAKVVRVPAAGWAEPGRQAGIDAAGQPWILVLDADERAGANLGTVAAAFAGRDDIDGVWLARQNFQFGWWVPQSGLWPDWQLRLFRRTRAQWPGHRTHVGAQVAGRCAYGPEDPGSAIAHHSFPTVGAWIRSMNRYTELEADRYEAAGRRATLLKLLGTPTLRFADQYVRHRGYRGGRYGLAVGLMSFCYWLLAELKLWERGLESGGLPEGSVASPAASDLPSSSEPDAR